MELEQFPDRQSQKYPFRVSLALPNEVREKIEYLRSQGKDTGEIMRRAVCEILSPVKVPPKKVG